MRIVVVGRAHETGGFALAGVETLPCASAADAAAALTTLADAAPPPGLVVVSRWAERAAAAEIARIRERSRPPVVVALPDIEEARP